MKKLYKITNKIIFLSILLLTAVALSEPEWITFPGGSGTPGEPPIITIESNTTGATVYTVQIPGMYREQVTAPNGMIFDDIRIPEYGVTLDIGKPKMPNIREMFATPVGADVDMSVTDVQSCMFEDYYIYPQQPPRPFIPDDNTEYDFYYDSEFYNSDVWFPYQDIVNEMPGILREFEVEQMKMQPIKFNPVQHKLDVEYFFRVTITYTNPGGWVEEPRPSADFCQMYPYLIKNLEGISFKGEFSKEGINPNPSTYLIIYDNYFEGNQQFLDILNSLKSYIEDPNRGSFTVEIVSTTQTGTDATSIWNYIHNVWNQTGNLEYVLLIGDIIKQGSLHGIPMPEWGIPFYQTQRPPTDMGYARMTGWGNDPLMTDCYPDIIVGRMFIDNLDEFENIVNKTRYYFYSDLGNEEWEKKCILVSHRIYSKYDPYLFYRTKKGEIFHYDYEQNHNYKNPPNEFKNCHGVEGANNSDVALWIYRGASIINYFGHGDIDCWPMWSTNSDPDLNTWNAKWIHKSMNNEFPVVFQVGCNVGMLDDVKVSLCKSWLNDKYGAVACSGATRFMDPDPYTAEVDKYIVRLIYGWIPWNYEPVRPFGAALYGAIILYFNRYICSYEYHNNQVLDICCLPDGLQIYGEPSLRIRSGVDWSYNTEEVNTKKELLGLGNLSIECLYPNPSYDNFNFKVNVPSSGNISINIYDISGRLVSKKTVYAEKSGLIESSVDVRELSNGVYTFCAEMNGSSVSKRIVIVR